MKSQLGLVISLDTKDIPYNYPIKDEKENINFKDDESVKSKNQDKRFSKYRVKAFIIDEAKYKDFDLSIVKFFQVYDE